MRVKIISQLGMDNCGNRWKTFSSLLIAFYRRECARRCEIPTRTKPPVRWGSFTREEHRCVNYPRRPISSGTRVNGYSSASHSLSNFQIPTPQRLLDKSIVDSGTTTHHPQKWYFRPSGFGYYFERNDNYEE